MTSPALTVNEVRLRLGLPSLESDERTVAGLAGDDVLESERNPA